MNIWEYPLTPIEVTKAIEEARDEVFSHDIFCRVLTTKINELILTKAAKVWCQGDRWRKDEPLQDSKQPWTVVNKTGLLIGEVES